MSSFPLFFEFRAAFPEAEALGKQPVRPAEQPFYQRGLNMLYWN
jgi:hypothetical protein